MNVINVSFINYETCVAIKGCFLYFFAAKRSEALFHDTSHLVGNHQKDFSSSSSTYHHISPERLLSSVFCTRLWDLSVHIVYQLPVLLEHYPQWTSFRKLTMSIRCGPPPEILSQLICCREAAWQCGRRECCHPNAIRADEVISFKGGMSGDAPR